MADDSPFSRVRWHLPAAILGARLPPGYHVLEAPLRYFLCLGDEEIAEFLPGTNPREIERAALAHSRQQAPLPQAPTDPITGLLWSVAVREDAAEAAFQHDLHVVIIHLTGMGTLMDLYGFETAHTIMRDIAVRLKPLMGERDQLTRHSGDRLLILTTRPLDEIHPLVDLIHAQVAASSVETDWTRLPGSRIGVATVDRLTNPDPNAAAAVIDAVVLSAEVAATTAPEAGAEVAATTAPEAGTAAPVEVPAPAAESVPEMPAEVPHAVAPVMEEPVAREVEGPGTPVMEEPVGPVGVEEIPPETPYREMAPTGMGPVEARAEIVPPAASAGWQIVSPPPREEVKEPAAVQAAATAVESTQEPGEPSARIRLKGASLDISGLVATATVKLVHGSREVVGRAVGRNVQERRLFLVAEAAARAVTEFLPAGYGVVLHDIQPTPVDVGKALWAVVLFLTPEGEESLLGIAPIDGMMIDAAGKAVLSAVNRRIEPLLEREG